MTIDENNFILTRGRCNHRSNNRIISRVEEYDFVFDKRKHYYTITVTHVDAKRMYDSFTPNETKILTDNDIIKNIVEGIL